MRDWQAVERREEKGERGQRGNSEAGQGKLGLTLQDCAANATNLAREALEENRVSTKHVRGTR